MDARVTRTVRLAALLVASAMALVACGGTGESGGAGGEELSGTIAIDGSSTVAPISSAVAEEFNKSHPGVKAPVGTSGTGGGFKKLCANEIDIANASRAIKDEEKQACAAAGVEFSEFRVGLDGLAVVTSNQNTFLECLTVDQLKAIFKDGGVETWNQVDPKFPAEEVAIFAPGTDSGTFDFFVEEVLGDPKKPESLKPRTDYTASEDDNVLVQGLKGQRNSWGYFGFAYFKENKAALKAVKVAEKPGACVEPSDQSVVSGEYPLSRPLFIYVKKAALGRAEVKEFVKTYMEITPQVITDVGYTAAPQQDYQKALQTLESSS